MQLDAYDLDPIFPPSGRAVAEALRFGETETAPLPARGRQRADAYGALLLAS